MNKNVLRQTASWLLAQAAVLFLLGLGFWSVRSDAEYGNHGFRAEQWWNWKCCRAVMISLVLFQQLPCTCFHYKPLLPIHFLSLFFPLLLPLTAQFPVLFSPCCLHHFCVLLLAVVHERGPILETLCRDTFPAESQDGFWGRLKTLFLLHNQSWVHTTKYAASFIMWSVSWWLTKPVWILSQLFYCRGLSKLAPSSIAFFFFFFFF